MRGREMEITMLVLCWLNIERWAKHKLDVANSTSRLESASSNWSELSFKFGYVTSLGPCASYLLGDQPSST